MKDMIKRIREEREGFTLAELLIVVAIIAVLVAIAIPVFNSQLEKSREATDMADIRTAYAEVMTAALANGTVNEGNVTYNSTDKTWSATVSNLKQTQDKWQSDIENQEIGGVKIKDSGIENIDHTKSVTVKYDGSTVTFTQP